MDFVANRDLGAMRLKENDTENAKPLLELALQLHPDDPLTRLEIAKLRRPDREVRGSRGNPRGSDQDGSQLAGCLTGCWQLFMLS